MLLNRIIHSLIVGIGLWVRPAVGAEPQWEALIAEVERQEQVCVMGPNLENRIRYIQNQIVSYQATQQDLKGSWERLGIVEEPFPKPITKDIEEALHENFVREFLRASEAVRCTRVNAAYLFAVIKMNTLLAGAEGSSIGSQAMNPDWRFFLTDEEIDADRARAAWEFRYLTVLPAESVPSSCDVYARGLQRLQFVWQSPGPPLGYMLNVCGRSQNAHYLDEAVAAGEHEWLSAWDDYKYFD